MPDVIAVGVLVKPVDALNVTVDFRRVQYSQLISDMGLGFAVAGRHRRRLRARRRQRDSAPPASTCSPTCRRRCPPSPSAAASGTTPITASATKAPFQTDTVLFPPGDSEMHYTGGGGIVFEKFQFDVGFDRSETVKTFSVSAVLRF